VGSALAVLGLDVEQARTVFLFASVRAVLSAAVRLGLTGPLRAQRLLYELGPTFDDALETTRALDVDDAFATSPILDVAQGMHDRLYSRLFQS
jgi:urease accessory protein